MPAAVRRRYDEERLRLLATVLRVTPDGYRAGDARFAIGRIRWARGDRAGAVRVIEPTAEDAFAPTYAPVLQALAADEGDAPQPTSVARVEAIFRTERQRWAAFHDDRLSRFHSARYIF